MVELLGRYSSLAFHRPLLDHAQPSTTRMETCRPDQRWATMTTTSDTEQHVDPHAILREGQRVVDGKYLSRAFN